MITTRDVLRTHDEIHTVWELGMHENAMTKNEIIKANIQEIANNIMSKKEGFVFRLSGVLLCGIARLYSKKTYFFLIDCEEALARISLRFEPIEKKRKDKSKSKDGMEIDEETIKLWQGEKNIESIIELEKADENNFPPTELMLNSSETNTSPNIAAEIIVDNDFGNVPFEISACEFEEPINLPPLNQSDNDMPPAPFESDDGLNVENFENNEDSLQKSSKKNWFIIDSTPIIPLTQLSVILEDTSKTICQRPITKARICAVPSYSQLENDDLINEVKKIVENVPVFNGESHNDSDTIVDLPPLPSDAPNEIENDYFGGFNSNDDIHDFVVRDSTDDESDQEQDRNHQLFSKDIVLDLKHSLEKKREEKLLNIISNHSRRSLALSFFTTLSLKNRGIIDITQSSEESISLSKGPNFGLLRKKSK